MGKLKERNRQPTGQDVEGSIRVECFEGGRMVQSRGGRSWGKRIVLVEGDSSIFEVDERKTKRAGLGGSVEE